MEPPASRGFFCFCWFEWDDLFAFRPRDVANYRETTRTVDQLEFQARGSFRVFVQARK